MEEQLRLTAESYDRTVQAYLQRNGRTVPTDAALRFLDCLAPRATILDLGCGPGTDARFFSDAGYEVTGIDVSPEMIREAQRHAPKARFVVMDMRHLTLPNLAFDGVWANATLHHVPKGEIRDVLTAIARSLKPNGVLYCSVKRGDAEGLEADDRYGGVPKFWSYFSEERLRQDLLETGYRVLSLEPRPVGPWLRAYARAKAS